MTFTPKTQLKEKLYQIRMTQEMFQDLTEAAKKRKIPKQELIRQMIQYGISELNVDSKKGSVK